MAFDRNRPAFLVTHPADKLPRLRGVLIDYFGGYRPIDATHTHVYADQAVEVGMLEVDLKAAGFEFELL